MTPEGYARLKALTHRDIDDPGCRDALDVLYKLNRLRAQGLLKGETA